MGTNTGVKGFFKDFGKVAPPNTRAVAAEKPKSAVEATPIKEKETKPIDRAFASTSPKKVKSRVGRPPGVRSGSRSHKAKATLHISSSLLDYYRDWSWEARCNLGELVERAMKAYKKTNSTPKQK